MSGQLEDAADTAIEHVQADSLAGLGKPGGGEPGEGVCLNCGAELAGEFCHGCGQSARSLRRPFWSILTDSIETLFLMDGRLAQTLPALMVYPGRISRDYLDGRRARFIPPFRLYVFASLVFFVLLPLVTGQWDRFTADGPGLGEAREQVEQAREAGSISEEEYQEALDGLNQLEGLWQGGVPGLVAPSPPAADASEEGSADGESAVAADLAAGGWSGFMPEEALEAMRQSGEAGNADAGRVARALENPDRMIEETRRWIPRIMFVMLPVYAALLALVYLWRRRFFYFDHLIVSLHFHAALFFAMSLGAVAAMLVGWGWVMLGLLLYSNAYLYKINRVVYERGRVSSALRVLTLDFLYFNVLMFGLTIAVALGAISALG